MGIVNACIVLFIGSLAATLESLTVDELVLGGKYDCLSYLQFHSYFSFCFAKPVYLSSIFFLSGKCEAIISRVMQGRCFVLHSFWSE